VSEVMTVLGPVDSGSLGITLAHEHIFIDLSCLWQQPLDPFRSFLVDAAVAMSNRGLLSCDPYHCRDNMLLDNLDLAVAELALFRSLGGSTVVDLSSRPLGPYPLELREVARRTGLNIVASTGYYTGPHHPACVHEASVAELTSRMVDELTVGFAGTSVRAGIIGEIGTSSPVQSDEMKVLEAACLAHRETGAAVNVHLAIFGRQGLHVLELLESYGVDPGRLALSHLDELPDTSYHLSLAERGCFLEFDCFGSQVYFDEDNVCEPSDAERLDALLRLIEAGYERQILLSQDVCTKMQLRHYGGVGYDHILRSIVPRLRARGVSRQTIDNMLVHNPTAFLTGHNPSINQAQS
jgi:phosphotriesterase-related protein